MSLVVTFGYALGVLVFGGFTVLMFFIGRSVTRDRKLRMYPDRIVLALFFAVCSGVCLFVTLALLWHLFGDYIVRLIGGL